MLLISKPVERLVSASPGQQQAPYLLDTQDSAYYGGRRVECPFDVLKAFGLVFLWPDGGDQFVFIGAATNAAERNSFRGWYSMI